ncbi:hypothetical protein D3C78_1329600 [compost metagenome]
MGGTEGEVAGEVTAHGAKVVRVLFELEVVALLLLCEVEGIASSVLDPTSVLRDDLQGLGIDRHRIDYFQARADGLVDEDLDEWADAVADHLVGGAKHSRGRRDMLAVGGVHHFFIDRRSDGAKVARRRHALRDSRPGEHRQARYKAALGLEIGDIVLACDVLQRGVQHLVFLRRRCQLAWRVRLVVIGLEQLAKLPLDLA